MKKKTYLLHFLFLQKNREELKSFAYFFFDLDRGCQVNAWQTEEGNRIKKTFFQKEKKEEKKKKEGRKTMKSKHNLVALCAFGSFVFTDFFLLAVDPNIEFQFPSEVPPRVKPPFQKFLSITAFTVKLAVKPPFLNVHHCMDC